jgi:hypothetical protein
VKRDERIAFFFSSFYCLRLLVLILICFGLGMGVGDYPFLEIAFGFGWVLDLVQAML